MILPPVKIDPVDAVLPPPCTPGAPRPSLAAGRTPGDDPWRQVPAILARIPELSFPNRDYVITAYGAVGDGRTDDQAAIRRTIAACAEQGGGRVVVPPGEYLTGPLHLRSRVNLHVCEGATLKFTTDSCRYLPPVLTRWEGIECMGLSPLIYADEQRQIAVTGGGVLDGQAGPGRWWDWAGPWNGEQPTGWVPGQPHQAAARAGLMRWAETGVPVPQRRLDEWALLRPMFIQFYRCQDVLVEGVTVRNTPMWGIHPVLSRAVTVRGVRVASHGPNNDGCVVDSCHDVLIDGCQFDTGDDCVAVKSGRNEDGRRINVPAEDIVIRDCDMENGHAGIAIGSEMSGGVRRLFVERCVMNGRYLERAFRIKANSTRGGLVEEIYFRDVDVGWVREAAVHIDLLYAEAEEHGERPPEVRNVTIERLDCAHSGRGVWIEGRAAMPVRAVQISDSIFRRVDAPNVLRHVEDFRLRKVVFPDAAA